MLLSQYIFWWYRIQVFVSNPQDATRINSRPLDSSHIFDTWPNVAISFLLVGTRIALTGSKARKHLRLSGVADALVSPKMENSVSQPPDHQGVQEKGVIPGSPRCGKQHTCKTGHRPGPGSAMQGQSDAYP